MFTIKYLDKFNIGQKICNMLNQKGLLNFVKKMHFEQKK